MFVIMNIHYSRNIPKCCSNNVYPQQPVSLCILLFTALYSHHFHVLSTLPLDYILSWINPFHIWQCSFHLSSVQLFIIFYQRITWLHVLTTKLLSAVHWKHVKLKLQLKIIHFVQADWDLNLWVLQYIWI